MHPKAGSNPLKEEEENEEEEEEQQQQQAPPLVCNSSIGTRND